MAASPDSFVARRFKSTAPMNQETTIVPVRGYESILPRTDRMAASPDSFVARHSKSTAPMNQEKTIVPVRGYESTTTKRMHIRKSTLFSTDEDDDSNLSYDDVEEKGDGNLDDDNDKNKNEEDYEEEDDDGLVDDDDDPEEDEDDSDDSGDDDHHDDDPDYVDCDEEEDEEEEDCSDDPDYVDRDEEEEDSVHVGFSRTVEPVAAFQTTVTISNSSSSTSASETSAFSTITDSFSDVQLPIVSVFGRPSFVTQTLPNYKYDITGAPSPYRDSIVTYETMDTSGDPSFNVTEPFASAGIISLQSYVKRGRGMVWQNQSSSKLHYETDLAYFKEHTKPKAKLLQIPHYIFYPDGGKVRHVVSGKDSAFVIVSGGTFDRFHDKVCFQELIRDACIPAKNTIPRQDKLRRNSGPSVGLSSSQGTTRSSKQAFATPVFGKGTQRYSKIFGIASETSRVLLQSCGLSAFLPPTGSRLSPKQLSYKSRCEELCKGNLYLGLSFKIYVHHPADVDNHKGHFHAHRDVNNLHYNSPNDIFFSAWDTWFEPLLNLYVTGTIIFCGRRSQEELYDRILRIGLATEQILARADALPLSRRTMNPEMLCPPGLEFVTQGSHLLQIHALTPNEYLYKLSRLLGGKQGLSAYLATEIILGFHQTSNNALRFHRFMTILMSSVKQHYDLRFLGQLTFIESYQRYCYETYGSFEGTTDRNGIREGNVRHQPSVSSPIAHYVNRSCLRDLVALLESYGKVSCYNQRQYEALVRNIKGKILGLGDLKAQKIIMTFASLDLFISKQYMSYFSTGSLQQVKNLKKEPFGFRVAGEVRQLRRNILLTRPHLLPMQADEYICAVSSDKEEKVGEIHGEVYYNKQSIFNAGVTEDGRITLHRFSWSKKANKTAPCIVFNDSRLEDNHYVPKWATETDGNVYGNAFVSLCSTQNLRNVPKYKKKSENVLEFNMNRDILPADFQKVLSADLYHVVPDLLTEVSEYLECQPSDLTNAITCREVSPNRGFSCNIDMNRIHNSSSRQNKLFGPAFVTRHHARIAILIKILTEVTVDEKASWTENFFGKNVKGFLLLLPRSKCGSFCVVAAFLYIDQGGTVKCCMLDERGNAATTW